MTMNRARWTKSQASEMGRRGGVESGQRRRLKAMERTIGPIREQARRSLAVTSSTLTPEGLRALNELLARVYIGGWECGYNTGWRKANPRRSPQERAA